MSSALFHYGHDLAVAASGADLVSGMDASRVTTHFQRPNWEGVFEELKERHRDVEKVGVFFCGPIALRNALQEVCAKHSAPKGSGRPRFKMHAENFS